jgi:DNA ligase 1
VLLHDLVTTSARVRETRARSRKVAALAHALAALPPHELRAGVGLLAGAPRQGKIGVGYAVVQKVSAACQPAAEPSLHVAQVDQMLDELAAESGAGSARRREQRLGTLLCAATAGEQDFLVGVLLGAVRQGALEGVMVEAIASAFQLDAALVRRALMMSGDLGRVTEAAREGAAALAAFELQLFRPVQPMLASPADDVETAMAELGDASLEYKLDGARVQIHKEGDEVRVYSRRLNEVTPAVPEIVEAVRAIPARALVLDGETIALRPDGRPHPFQATMRRFGRRKDVEALRASLPLSLYLFDALRIDDDTLIDAPTDTRWRALAAAASPQILVPRIRTADPAEAEAFFDRALFEGHEGVMAKALDLPYEAGRRGKGWRKLKVAHTLDLVVLAAEWGSGRRQGWLSNLHLGARDPDAGGFVMLGKTFKGMTDELLGWQTEALKARAIGQEGHIVHVRPELVVEIAFNDVQESPQYPGGLALRFARVKRYRHDKTAAEADTIETVRGIHRAAGGG